MSFSFQDIKDIFNCIRNFFFKMKNTKEIDSKIRQSILNKDMGEDIDEDIEDFGKKVSKNNESYKALRRMRKSNLQHTAKRKAAAKKKPAAKRKPAAKKRPAARKVPARK